MPLSLFCSKTSNGSHLPLFKSRLLIASRTADLIMSQPPVACLPHCPTHCPLVHKGYLYMLFLPQHTLPPAPSTSAFALMLMSQLSCHLLQEESSPPHTEAPHRSRRIGSEPLLGSPCTLCLPSQFCSCHGPVPPGWERAPHPGNVAQPLHILGANCTPGPTWHFTQSSLRSRPLQREKQARGSHCRPGRQTQAWPLAATYVLASVLGVSLNLKGRK